MRVTGGTLRNRQIAVPKGRDIRPTSDKVRLAVYNALASRGFPEDVVVLDAFCGTGALGIEALSRGARFCIFMDVEPSSLDYCRANIKTLKLDRSCVIIQRDALNPRTRHDDLDPAGLVFLDPPYRQGLIEPALAGLVDHGWIAPGATIVIECAKGEDPVLPPPYHIVFDRLYGDTRIVFAQG